MLYFNPILYSLFSSYSSLCLFPLSLSLYSVIRKTAGPPPPPPTPTTLPVPPSDSLNMVLMRCWTFILTVHRVTESCQCGTKSCELISESVTPGVGGCPWTATLAPCSAVTCHSLWLGLQREYSRQHVHPLTVYSVLHSSGCEPGVKGELRCHPQSQSIYSCWSHWFAGASCEHMLHFKTHFFQF